MYFHPVLPAYKYLSILVEMVSNKPLPLKYLSILVEMVSNKPLPLSLVFHFVFFHVGPSTLSHPPVVLLVGSPEKPWL
jgi:hypothetical protein